MDTTKAKAQESRQWLRMRAVELLFDVGLYPFFAHLIILSVVVWVLFPTANLDRLLSWALVLVAGIFVQIVFLIRMRRGTLTPEKANLVTNFFSVFGVFVGLAWAALFVFMFPENDYFRAVFLAFAAGGLAMGGVATQHMLPVGTIISVVLALFTSAIVFALSDISDPVAHGIGLALYATVLVDLTLRLNKSAMRAARLQLEQKGLLQQLSDQTKALEEAKARAESAQREAEIANDGKSRFLAHASHDLRQPLHAINLFLEALPGTKSEAERSDIMNRVRQSLDVLTKLFDSLLDVTLLDTGGIKVRKTAFRPGDLIAEVARDFEIVADACHVNLRFVHSSAWVHGDPVLLRRMLQNLISNAIQYGNGGRVLVGCRRRSNELVIQVIDSGAGIAIENQQRIFAEFERLQPAQDGDAATSGLGLGLAIVQRIAHETGLTVRLASREGRGSAFSIDGLEFADAGAQGNTGNIKRTDVNHDTASVFVLDDDPDILKATELLLRRWGFRPQVSVNRDDLMRARPDVVICDHELGAQGDGLEVLDEFYRTSGLDIPSIIVSGDTSEELRDETLRRGIPLLRKPIRPVQLRSALLNALANHKRPREAANDAAAARLGNPRARKTAET